MSRSEPTDDVPRLARVYIRAWLPVAARTGGLLAGLWTVTRPEASPSHLAAAVALIFAAAGWAIPAWIRDLWRR